jgi:two-component system, chemotaxis family, chemotaxis protein CheY
MAKTIFIVDDSAVMRASLRENLESSGYLVEYAGDGVMALRRLQTGMKPDLIITDINMPNMGGIEFVKAVRSEAGLRFIPILVLTSEVQPHMKEEARKSGATGWLVKPTSATDLIKAVKQVLPGA